jgi:YbbR domain-containing protein
MLSSLGRNLRSLLWALVLGLSVWVAAVTAADPDQVQAFPTAVKLEVVGQDPGLVISSPVPTEVRLTMRAPQSIWNQMTARPDSVRAVLDLAGVQAGQHKLAVQVQVDVRPVRIVTVSPSSVTLSLEPLVNRTFPLEATLSGEAAVGYQAGDLTLDPKVAVVAGPESIVSRVNGLRVAVNISGVRESVDLDLPIRALDQSGAPLADLTIQPQTAHVSLPVIRQGGYRDLAVKVVVRGQVAPGYRLDSISVFPPVVTVYSAHPELVSALPGVIQTQPLDLNAASSDLSLLVSLDVPPDISVVGQQTVLIQAGISPVQSSLTLGGQKVELTGLPANLEARISPATVDVILSGPSPILDTLTRQDVRVTVDVTKLTPGSYQLTPSVKILASGVTVESLLPGTVEVVLVPKAAVTPTP